MNYFKAAVVLALVCASIAIVASDNKVNIRIGDGTKRSIVASQSAWGGITIQVTRSTKVGNSVSFTRFFYNVHHNPVVRAVVRKVTGTFNLDDNSVTNIDADAVTHAMWLPYFALYAETNGVDGLQLDDTIIHTGEIGGLLGWTANYTDYTTADGVKVLLITQCWDGSAAGAGELCFYFHTGNGQYVRNGVTVYPGEFKIDKHYTLGSTFKGLIGTSVVPVRLGLVAYMVSSTDAIDNGTFVAQSNAGVTQTSNSLEITADYTLKFSSGDTGYVNSNKTAIFVDDSGTETSCTILMRELSLQASSSGSSSITMTGTQFSSAKSGSFSTVQQRKVFVWSFLEPLSATLNQIKWDPTIGTSDQNAPNAGFFAAGSVLIASILAFLGLSAVMRM